MVVDPFGHDHRPGPRRGRRGQGAVRIGVRASPAESDHPPVDVEPGHGGQDRRFGHVDGGGATPQERCGPVQPVRSHQHRLDQVVRGDELLEDEEPLGHEDAEVALEALPGRTVGERPVPDQAGVVGAGDGLRVNALNR